MTDETPIAIALIGASGRLGRAIAAEAVKRPDMRLSAGVVSADSVNIGADLGELAGLPLIGIEAQVDADDAIAKADVIVDVSVPRMTRALCGKIGEAGGKPLVTGVTGLGIAEQTALAEASAIAPVLHARNFSIGAALMERLVAAAAGALDARSWDIEIIEAHHRRKKDAPSGTALAVGEAAAKARGADLSQLAEFGRTGNDLHRRAGAIGFSAVRGGGVVGEHTALFLHAFEELEIRHRALDRAIFARGALEAAKFVHGRTPGFYSMQDVITAGGALDAALAEAQNSSS